jgi:hypothetical protein
MSMVNLIDHHIGDYEKGGLKRIDIESYFISLKASWVSRLADSKFSNWKLIPLKYKALMISTLPNIERFRFDYDKNKLFIFSNFFSQLSFSHSM